MFYSMNELNHKSQPDSLLGSDHSLQKYHAYNLRNFRSIPQVSDLNLSVLRDIEVVGRVLPFRTNNYVVDKLINWNDPLHDPIFILTFPQKGMLIPQHYQRIAELLDSNADEAALRAAIQEIRTELNPHPAGQLNLNLPLLDGIPLQGVQHKYDETVLFFPLSGQTCHAYCTFCFRWPQFTQMEGMKFVAKESDTLWKYLHKHREVTNLLFTGGDPLFMKTEVIKRYTEVFLKKELLHVSNIRFGTKALSYWPYRFTKDNDASDLLRHFERLSESGRHIALMAHFNHYTELETLEVKEAIRLLRNSGVVIRTQSPLLRNINDDAEVWTKMLQKQVALGLIPYYMFVARDTGASHYFSVPLAKVWETFRTAYSGISGLGRTVRGPSMSAEPGKVLINGVTEIENEKVFVLSFLQARNPAWVGRPFFAAYDENACWLSDLKPAFNQEKFFWEDEYASIVDKRMQRLEESGHF